MSYFVFFCCATLLWHSLDLPYTYFVNFENWDTNIYRDILHVILKILSIVLLSMLNNTSAYLGCKTNHQII